MQWADDGIHPGSSKPSVRILVRCVTAVTAAIFSIKTNTLLHIVQHYMKLQQCEEG